MAFAEQLLTWAVRESSEHSEEELDTMPPSVLLQVVELLGRDDFFDWLVLSVELVLYHFTIYSNKCL